MGGNSSCLGLKKQPNKPVPPETLYSDGLDYKIASGIDTQPYSTPLAHSDNAISLPETLKSKTLEDEEQR